MGQEQSGNVGEITLSGEIPDIPSPREVPEALDLELVKNVYNTFCDRVVDAGLPGPPKWT